MLTQKYNKKIDKFIAIYKFAYRYRVLLCSLVIISALTSATLMGLVGTIIDDITPEKFTYGDDFELEASSLFNDKPKIQYSSNGANHWSYDKPILVGKYDARTVSKNVLVAIDMEKSILLKLFLVKLNQLLMADLFNMVVILI